MKRKRSLILALVAMIGLAHGVEAQEVACPSGYVAHDTTLFTANRYTNNVPFGSWSATMYVRHRAWSVYSVEELGDLGITAGSLIRSIGYGMDDTSYSVPSVHIYMKEVPLAAIASVRDTLAIDSMQLVFSAERLDLQAGWNDIALDTVFGYSGTGGLMVAVCRDSVYADQSAEFWSVLGGSAERRYNANTGNWNYVYQSGNRPAMRFGVCVPTAVCQRPYGVRCSATDSSVSVRYLSMSQQFQVAVGAAGFDPDTVGADSPMLHGTTQRTLTVGELEAGGLYDVYVRGICGTDTTQWSTVRQVRTYCGVQTLPYTNPCSSATQTDSCVVMYNASLSSGWSGGIVPVYQAGTPMIVLPEFDSPLNMLHVSFVQPSSYVEIGVVTDASDTNSYIAYDTLMYAGPKQVDFRRYTGSDGRVAIRWNNGALRNITVDTLTECYAPYGVQVAYDSGSTATVGWRSRATTATGYRVAWRQAGAQTSRTREVAQRQCVIDSLEANAFYEVRVQALCGDSNVGDESQMVRFTTECRVLSELPYRLQGAQTASLAMYPYFQAPCWTYLLDTTTQTSIWVLPEIDTALFPMDQLKLTYDIRYQHNYNGRYGELEIGVMDNTWDTSTFVAFDTATLQSNVFNAFSGTCYSYSPLRQGKHLAFRSPEGTIMSLQNIVIEHSPCHPVSDLTLTERAPYSLTLDWHEQGNATGWIVDYASADGQHQGRLTVGSKPATIGGLQSYTPYDISVRAYNATDTSEARSGRYKTAPDSTHAETVVQIGTPSNASNRSFNYPVHRGYRHSWRQTVYQLSWYAVPGLIDTVWFYCKTAYGSPTDTSLTLYLGHTAGTVATGSDDWVPADSLHRVFHSTSWMAPGGDRWVPIVLDTPFYYNGTDNLAVVFSHSNTIEHGAADYFTYDNTYTSGVTMYIGGTADSLARHPGDSDGLRETIRAHARFSILTSSCQSVRNVHVTDISRDTVRLGWQEQGSATRWQVEWSDEAGQPVGSMLVDSVAQCTVAGLAGNHSYRFRVRPVCGDGDTGYFVGNASAYILTCAAPDSLAVAEVGDTTATVSWRENGGASLWEVRYEADDGSHSGTLMTGNNPVQLTGLQPWTHYDIAVRAVCGSGDSSLFSPTAAFTTRRGYFEHDVVQIGSLGDSFERNAPFCAYYRHSWVQMIFPADSIGMEGYIDTIWWYAATVGSALPDTSVTIYMGHSAQTVHAGTSDWLAADALQQVFHAAQAQPSTTGWFALPLESSFHYNGTDNLVVCVSYHGDPYTSDWKYYYNTHPGAVLKRSNDYDVEAGQHPGTSQGQLLYDLPVTRLSMSGDDNSCARPTNLTATDIAFDSVLLQWQGGPNDSLYTVVCLSADGTDSLVFTVTDTAVVLDGLREQTDYEVSVTTSCVNGGQSHPSTFGFTTIERCPSPVALVVVDSVNADAVQLQWTDNAGASQWQVSYGVGLTDPSQGTVATTLTSSYMMPPLAVGQVYDAYVRTVCGADDTSIWSGPVRFTVGVLTTRPNRCDTLVTCHSRILDGGYVAYGGNNDTIVIFPASEDALVAVEGSVDMVHYNSFGELELQVYDGAGTDGTLWGRFDSIESVPRLISTHGPLTLVFVCHDFYDGGVQLEVSCVEDNGCHASPRAVVHHALDTTARMHWTYTDPTPQSFTVAYAPFGSFDTSNSASYQLFTGIVDTSFLLTGLQPGTHYRAAVRAECGGGIHSRWTIANDFYTACMAIKRTDLPFSEDFASWGSSNLELIDPVCNPCWRYSTDGTRSFVYHNSSQNPAVPHFVEFHHYGYAYTCLALPLFEDSIADLTLSFKAKNGYTGLYDQYVEVVEAGVMDDPHDFTTFTPVFRDSLVGDSWQSYTVPLNTYTGTGRYIAIVAPRLSAYSSGYSLYVGQIGVSMELPCMPPMAVMLDTATENEATLRVVDSTSPDTRTFVISRSDDRLSAFDSLTVSDSVCIFSHLDEGTRYYVWARNNMEIDREPLHSPWTGPVTFETAKPPRYFHAEGRSDNPSLGTVTVVPQSGTAVPNGSYSEGTVLVFTAVPSAETVRFLGWNDGDTLNPRTVTLLSDTLFTAAFELLGVSAASSVDITLAPNPADQRVFVRSGEVVDALTCYDLHGSVVYAARPCSSEFIVDVSRWPSGTYVLRLTTASGVVLRKLVVK